jgi:SAM-dependent methyltransferase
MLGVRSFFLAGGRSVPDRSLDEPRPSWRIALAPGEQHGFYATPGWWDLRDIGREPDDVPRLRAALLGAFPALPDGSAVLDLGAGTGTLLTLMAGYYPGLRYTLIDANPAALDRAAEKLLALIPNAADALALSLIAEAVDPLAEQPLPGGPYRLITSSIALHDIARPAAPDDEPGRARHAAEHAALLRRVLTAIEPGGHFVYADAMRPRFRVWEHLAALAAAGFVEVDCAYVLGRMLVCGGQRPPPPPTAGERDGGEG